MQKVMFGHTSSTKSHRHCLF